MGTCHSFVIHCIVLYCILLFSSSTISVPEERGILMTCPDAPMTNIDSIETCLEGAMCRQPSMLIEFLLLLYLSFMIRIYFPKYRISLEVGQISNKSKRLKTCVL